MTCKIRKWELSDAKDLSEALSNKKIQDNLRDGLPYPYTEQDGVDFISGMLSADEKETFAFAISVDGKAVGSIGVFRQGNIHRQTAEMGYFIAEKYWDKGIMTEAVTQICEYVFEKSDIIRIYAEPFAYNAASCRVLEKVGFQYEGTLRSNAVKNGKVMDMKMYSLLKAEGLERAEDCKLRALRMRSKEYFTATVEMADAIHNILHTAIRTVYPKYYPKEVVDFFCQHHSREHILEGIASGNMGVLIDSDVIIGTGCYDHNHITGVYVLPNYQKQGCGSKIMDCLETEISKKYDTVLLDASLSAVCLYEHRGYQTVGHGIYELQNDVKLVYEVMEKKLY